MSDSHDLSVDGPLPGGLWENLGDGKFRRLPAEKPAPKARAKAKPKKKAAKAEEAGEE